MTYFYLLSTTIILLSGLLCLVLRRRTRQKGNVANQYARIADEKAPNLQRQYLPGDSPGYYTGDPTNDVLVVKAMDLTPNPPNEE